MHRATDEMKPNVIKLLRACQAKGMDKRDLRLREEAIAITLAMDGGLPKPDAVKLIKGAVRRHELSYSATARQGKNDSPRPGATCRRPETPINKSAAPVAITPEGLFKAPEVAQYLNVSAKTLESWRAKGEGPKHSKVGRGIRYSGRDVLDYVANGRRTAT